MYKLIQFFFESIIDFWVNFYDERNEEFIKEAIVFLTICLNDLFEGFRGYFLLNCEKF